MNLILDIKKFSKLLNYNTFSIIVEAYRFFCMMVGQRYIGPEGSGIKENEFYGSRGPKKFTRQDWKNLSIEDRKKMTLRKDCQVTNVMKFLKKIEMFKNI